MIYFKKNIQFHMSVLPKLSRQMGLAAVVATGVSSMVGASINVVPFMIHRSVPAIGQT